MQIKDLKGLEEPPIFTYHKKWEMLRREGEEERKGREGVQSVHTPAHF